MNYKSIDIEGGKEIVFVQVEELPDANASEKSAE